MRAKFINEKFKEKTDPIHDMKIGVMPQIKKELQLLVDLYGDGEKLEEISSEDECGYMVEIKWRRGVGGVYSITYNYEYGWTAGYEDSFQPNSDSEECEDLDEAVSRIEGWMEYGKDSNNDW